MTNIVNNILREICTIYFMILNIWEFISFIVVFVSGAGGAALGNILIMILFVSYIVAYYIIRKKTYYDTKSTLILSIISIILITISIPFIVIHVKTCTSVARSDYTIISNLLLCTIPGILLLLSIAWSFFFCRNKKD